MLIGHASQLNYFITAHAAGRLSHAYLVAGVASVGKAQLATELSAYLVCTASAGKPCGACSSCQQAYSHAHPDVLWLKPEQGSDGIAIDQVREAGHFTSITALSGGWRVVVVDPADSLTPQAANALLKVLEEPLGRTLFLLLAHEPRRVPRTIRSRCQLVHLSPVPNRDIIAELKNRGLSATKADELARLAGGRPGVGLALAFDEPQLQAIERATQLYHGLANKRGWGELQTFLAELPGAKDAESGSAGDRVGALVSVWVEAARDELLTALQLTHRTRLPNAEGTAVDSAYRRCAAVLEARERLAHNAHARLTLESLGINLSLV